MRNRILGPMLVFTGLCLAAATAVAGPKVIAPTDATFTLPSETFPYFFEVALDGNRIAAATYPNLRGRNVYIYERSADGTWSPPELAMVNLAAVFHSNPIRLAFQGNLLAMAFRNQLHIAERAGPGWINTVIATPPGIMEMGADVEIDGDTIVVSGESNRAQALIYRKNAAGIWTYTGHVDGEEFTPGPYEDFFGGDIDISGNTIVVGSTNLPSPDGQPSPRAHVFSNINGSWVRTAIIGPPQQQGDAAGFGTRVAIEGDSLILAEFGPTLHLYRRSATTWTHASSARPPEAMASALGFSPAISGNLILQGAGTGDSGSWLLVYQRDGAQLKLVARLDEESAHFDLNGRNAVGASGQILRFFQIPTDLTQPPLRQDNFQDGNADGWAPFLSTSWTVATSGNTRVYRQLNLASEARSVLTGADWTNQAIEADIKPTQFDGADRWFGLAVRFTDPANYYYVTLRSSNMLLVRKMVNGTFETIASRAMPVALNQTYRVRLEATGNRIRCYIGQTRVAEVLDTSLSHGQAALLTYRTRADFDNVRVTPNRFAYLLSEPFTVRPPEGTWIETGTGTWGDPPEEPADPDFPDNEAALRNYRQTSLTGGARSHTGVSTGDQIVQAKVVPNSMAATGWFGVMARYVDDGNYYYLKVAGATGEASLRKLVNGAIVELARVPFTARTNVSYVVRLEVVGTSLRAYINDRFLLEATDNSHATGKYGLVTYRTAATFDDFVATQP